MQYDSPSISFWDSFVRGTGLEALYIGLTGKMSPIEISEQEKRQAADELRARAGRENPTELEKTKKLMAKVREDAYKRNRTLTDYVWNPGESIKQDVKNALNIDELFNVPEVESVKKTTIIVAVALLAVFVLRSLGRK